MIKYLSQFLLIAVLLIIGCSDQREYFGLYIITDEDCEVGTIHSLETVNIMAKPGEESFDVTLILSGNKTETIEGTIKDGKLTTSGNLNGISTTLTGEFTNANTFHGVVVSAGGKTTCDFITSK